MLGVAIELYCRIHCTQNRRSASFSRIHRLVLLLQYILAALMQPAEPARMMSNKHIHTKLRALDQMLFATHS